MIILGRPLTPALLFLPLALVVISGITLGIGLFVSSFSVFFADIVNIYNFVLRLGMFVSGVFYNLDLLPDHLQNIVRLIPTYHMIILFRDPVYAGTIPDIGSIGYAILWMCISIFFGFWVFSRLSDAYAYRL